MRELKNFLFFYFLFSWFNIIQASVFTQTKSGIPVHWPASSNTVDIYVNSQNGNAMDEGEIQSIAASSVSEWNGVANITLRKNITSGQGQVNFNEMYFSTDPNFFNGSGVLGLTQVGFKESNGEIVEADILINDNYLFTSHSTEVMYLGNVMTHELGHFLGLGHGQVVGSTMFYALTRGQNQINDDDKAGLYSIYPNGSNEKGYLSGTIVGGKSLIPVFGTYVQAISVSNGKVAGSTVSEINGRFRINGLNKNDQYLLYTSPLKQIGVPTNYSTVKNDFCEGSKSYRGSFFQSCGSSGEGFPLALKLTTGALEVGKVTIRCGLDVPPDYFQTKGNSSLQFDLQSYSTQGLGGSFVGYFSNTEMASGTSIDKIHYDLSSITDWDTISIGTPLYLHLKILNQTFFSPFKANISVSRSGVTSEVTPKYTQNPDGWLNLDTDHYLAINRSNSSDNNFTFFISPQDMRGSIPTGIPFSRNDYFPSFDEFADSYYFYLFVADIVKSNGDGTYTQVSSRTDILSDNANCPDAINTYALTTYSANGTPSEGSNRKKALGCGTVDFDGRSGNGPGGFMIGLILSFILSYALSRYSKLA